MNGNNKCKFGGVVDLYGFCRKTVFATYSIYRWWHFSRKKTEFRFVMYILKFLLVFFFKGSWILLNFVINFVFDVKTALEHHIGGSRATRISNCILPHSKRGGGGRLGNFLFL